MHGTYIGNNKMLIHTLYGVNLVMPSTDRGLMPLLVANGGYEMPLTKYCLDQLKPGNVFVDVGANVGYFTLLAALKVGGNGAVYSFEASPTVFKNLKENVLMNWLDKQVKLINKAAYSHAATMKFHDSIITSGVSSLNISPEYLADPSDFEIIEVEAVRLEDELQAVDTIDMLKLDIEGSEYRALLGMMSLIRQNKIKQIVFEWNKPLLGAEADVFLSLLSQIQMEMKCIYYTLNSDGKPALLDIELLHGVEFYPFVLIRFFD